jgi:hypothetical protein
MKEMGNRNQELFNLQLGRLHVMKESLNDMRRENCEVEITLHQSQISLAKSKEILDKVLIELSKGDN